MTLPPATALMLVVDSVALRTYRLGAGMTQHDLARLAGVARITITRLEAGKPASPTSVKRIADALGINAGQIAKVVEA